VRMREVSVMAFMKCTLSVHFLICVVMYESVCRGV